MDWGSFTLGAFLSCVVAFASAAGALVYIMRRQFLCWYAARVLAVGLIALTFPPAGQLLFDTLGDAIALRTIATDIAVALTGPILATYIGPGIGIPKTRAALWAMLPIGLSRTLFAPSIAYSGRLDWLHDLILAGLIGILLMALGLAVRAKSRAAVFQAAAWGPGIAVGIGALYWELVKGHAAPFYFEAILVTFMIEFVIAAAGIGDGFMAIERQRDAAIADVRAATVANSLDPLTGIANRRGLARRFRDNDVGRPTGVAVVDCDWFKRINDNFGHDVGDEVLVTVAQALRGEDSFVGRLGGEEFMMLLYGPGWEHNAEVARRRIETLVREAIPEIPFDVTASAGLAAVRDDDSMESVMKRADRALYAAKGAGRDRSLRMTEFGADALRPLQRAG